MLTFHWRGGYLTRAVLDELLDLIKKAGEEKRQDRPHCVKLAAGCVAPGICRRWAGKGDSGRGKRRRAGVRLDCGGMEFEKLADLLELGQFELIGLPEGEAGKIPSDIRLVYMMNDTAESFLVFHEAVLTGNYLPDYEGELSASLDKEETDNTDVEGEEKGRYILAVHQGDTVCTLFFKNISLECELYDYGGIGHFWVKGYEYLRS